MDIKVISGGQTGVDRGAIISKPRKRMASDVNILYGNNQK